MRVGPGAASEASKASEASATSATSAASEASAALGGPSPRRGHTDCLNAAMENLAPDRDEPDASAIGAAAALQAVRRTALSMVDRSGHIASWSEGVRRMLGWARADWTGQPLQIAFTPEDVQRGVPQSALQRAAATGCSDATRWMRRQDGSRLFARLMSDGAAATSAQSGRSM